MRCNDLGRRLKAATGGLAMGAVLLGAVGCDNATGPADGDTTFQVLLTGSSSASLSALFDAAAGPALSEQENPAQSSQVESAIVWISNIHLVGGGHGRVDLFDAGNGVDPIELELMDLEGDVTIDLTEEVPVPEDRYGQLRLGVDEILITLADDMTFGDGSGQRAMVPSDFLRINLNGDLEFEGGENTVMLANFDLSRSFVFEGPPGAPMGILVKPVLFQEVARNNDG